MFSTPLSFFLSENTTGQQVRQKLLAILQNESVQAVTALELNQWASMTYHEGQHSKSDEDLCEVIFETLHSIVKRPANYTVLTIQKALLVARHVLLVGADRCINEARLLGPAVDQLREYNTALIAQQTSWIHMLKGGAVDQGEPVREASNRLYQLLIMPVQQLQQERERHADPHSLVPIGSRDQIIFLNDEQRYRNLQQRIQLQQKSNLVKPQDGFGGGYLSKDGSNIVGAAHSLEEMLEKARLEQQKFTDDEQQGSSAPSRGGLAGFADYLAPTQSDLITSAVVMGGSTTDWLSMESSTPATSTVTADLLDLAPTQTLADSYLTGTKDIPPPNDDLLNLGLPVDPRAVPTLATVTTPGMSLTYDHTISTSVDPFTPKVMTTTVAMKPPPPPMVATPLHDDPFAAFDALAQTMTSSRSVQAGTGQSVKAMALDSLTSFPVTHPPSMPSVATTTSSIQVSKIPIFTGTAHSNADNDDDDAFVMGGSVGSGLQPLGQAPAAPPPPPPGVPPPSSSATAGVFDGLW